MYGVVLDTHAFIWALLQDSRLSRTAWQVLRLLEGMNHWIAISAITLVEMVYLCEKGKIPAEALRLAESVLGRSWSAWKIVPVDKAIVDTVGQISRIEVPDMPDRKLLRQRLSIWTCLW